MTTPENQEVTEAGYTEDSAASALLEKWGKPDDGAPPEAKAEEEAPAAEQTEQVDAPVEDEPQAQAEESDDVEIDVGGEKFRVPSSQAEQAKRIEAKVKEIEAGTTRKLQEVAEARKVAALEIESAKRMQKVSAEMDDLRADYRMVARRLDALSRIDVNALAETDPVALTKMNAEIYQLQAAQQRIAQDAQQKQREGEEETRKAHAERMKGLNDFAQRSIKGWSPTYSDELMKFAVNELGYDAQRLRADISEPLIKAIDLAFHGHKARTANPKDKQVQSNKTLRPGGAQQNPLGAANAEKARLKLVKSGRLEDAVGAMLARSSARKR